MEPLQQIFHFEGQGVRTTVIDGRVMFVAKDVCGALEIANARDAVSRLNDGQKANVGISDGSQIRHYKCVTESGVYKLVFRSHKPEAEKFTDWITGTVLPSIRKHGAYMTPETIEKAMLNPDFIINLAGRLKDEQQKRLAAEQTIEEQKPKVAFAETCLSSNNSILVRELAKLATDEGVKIGQNRLYRKLRQWGYIMKYSTEPTQRAMDNGYFEVINRAIQTPDGTKTTTTTKVTPKGQIRIIDRLKREINVVPMTEAR